MTEQWKPIARLPGYEASDLGRIRSWKPRCGGKTPRKEPQVLRPYRSPKTGYERISIRVGKGSACHSVHRLVLEAFVGPCPSGMETCHNNGVRHDNRLSNLRWDTHQSNRDDIVRHGTTARGATHGSRTRPDAILRGENVSTSTLTTDEVHQIATHRGWLETDHLAGIFNVSATHIAKITAGGAWNHLPLTRTNDVFLARRSLSRCEAMNGLFLLTLGALAKDVADWFGINRRVASAKSLVRLTKPRVAREEVGRRIVATRAARRAAPPRPARDTAPRATRHGNSVLCDGDAIVVSMLLSERVDTVTAVAKALNVNRSVVRNLKDGYSHSRITGIPPRTDRGSFLTVESVLQIFAQRGFVSAPVLAETFGVNRQTIANIHTGKTWAKVTGLELGKHDPEAEKRLRKLVREICGEKAA